MTFETIDLGSRGDVTALAEMLRASRRNPGTIGVLFCVAGDAIRQRKFLGTYTLMNGEVALFV